MFRLIGEERGEECNVDVPNDTNLLGRGPFLKVTDKRVSRNHAALVCSGEKLELIPKHKNPCFFRKRGSADFVVLAKDVAQILQDGDEFSLLPKELIYKVEKVKPAASSTAESTDETPIEDEPLFTGMNADKDGDDEEPATAARDKAITDEATAMKDNAIDKTTSSDSLKTRKLPPWLLATKSDVTKEEHKKKVTKTATAAVAAKRPKPPETAPASKRHTAATTTTTKMETSVKIKEDDDRESTTRTKEDSDKDDEEHVPTKLDITKPSTSGDGGKTTTKMDTTDSDLLPCPYGKKCYRKNPVHFKEYSHNFSDDKNDDKDSGEDDDRPACPYGTACYRKNPLHKKQFSHNNPPVGDDTSPTRASRRPKRKAKKISALAGDSDDDGEPNTYDYTDSFIDDTNLSPGDDSTEYGGESEDSDWAPADHEDVSEVIDEAKDFVSNKKMHKPV